jgi:5-methylcytosine-specific restriction endonuclease McrA
MPAPRKARPGQRCQDCGAPAAATARRCQACHLANVRRQAHGRTRDHSQTPNPRATYRWRRLSAAILSRSTTCWICGRPGADSVDHLTPIAAGGDPFDPANLAPAHTVCNSARAARSPAQTPQTAINSRKW